MASEIVDRLREDARAADELHERSRELLVNAVRLGADAGLSQREIAAAVGRSQPEVSRLLRFHGSSPLGRVLVKNRNAVLDVATRYNVRNVRVFGSVATGTDEVGSDVDLLVELPMDMSLFTLARFEADLERVLDATVDVVGSDSLRKHLKERVLNEAVPL